MEFTPRVAALGALALFVGCGGSAGSLGHTSTPLTTPVTDADPLPFVPRPQSSDAIVRVEGESAALITAGGEDQARRMVPALIAAIRDADQMRLDHMLADEIISIRRIGERRSRAAFVQRIVLYGRRSLIANDARLEDLVELGRLRVLRASQHFAQGPLPSGVQATDLVVEVPVREGTGRTALRILLGWNTRGYLLVRSGPTPVILGV